MDTFPTQHLTPNWRRHKTMKKQVIQSFFGTITNNKICRKQLNPKELGAKLPIALQR